MNAYQSMSIPVHTSVSKGRKHHGVRFTGAIALGLLVAFSAQAGQVTVENQQDPNQVSFFSLDFGGPGLTTSALITQTDYTIEVNPDRLEARFSGYAQDVDQLILPGGIGTGNIFVEIVEGSSDGTFDLLTGEFTTQDLYAVHFTGDLSAFGLESPVLLPSSSTGVVTFAPDGTGHISMVWNGESQLNNLEDPANPITFQYACTVHTTFEAEPLPVLSLVLVPEVLSMELAQGVEGQLHGVLMSARSTLEQGQTVQAKRHLEAFVRVVNRLRGDDLSDQQADLLITKTDTVVGLIDG